MDHRVKPGGDVGGLLRATKTSELSKQTVEALAAERTKARLRDAKAKLRRHYCTVFKFWRACRFKRCRCARACMGDGKACLKRGVGAISRDTQWEARQKILAKTPASTGAPERAARECMPSDL
jgi:hypothetical protein